MRSAFEPAAPGHRPVRLVPVPKTRGLRWLTVLDPGTAAAYRTATARVALRVEAALGREVVANRVVEADPSRGVLRLEPWQTARRRFLLEARRRSRPGDVVVFADVRACYPSIEPAAVGAALGGLGCHPSEAGALVGLLERLVARGVPGLPAGPPASGVLANAVLAPVDGALRTAGIRHLRWVDDVVAFCADRGEGQTGLGVLRAALLVLGLDLAPEKTRLLDSRDAALWAGLGRFGSTVPALG